MEDKVRFFGFLPENKIKKYYDQTDLFVHPGRWKEPFGRTIIEAMARKRPILV